MINLKTNKMINLKTNKMKNSLYNLVIMLKMFERNDPLYKREMNRCVRMITQQGQSYQMTPVLENAFEDLNNMSLPDDTDDAIKQVRNYFEKYTH